MKIYKVKISSSTKWRWFYQPQNHHKNEGAWYWSHVHRFNLSEFNRNYKSCNWYKVVQDMTEPDWGLLSCGKLPQVEYTGRLIKILNQIAQCKETTADTLFSCPVGSKLFFPIHIHEKKKIWKPSHCTISCPTHHMP